MYIVLQRIRDLPDCVVVHSHGIVPPFLFLLPPDSWTIHRACCPPTHQRVTWLHGDSHGIVPFLFLRHIRQVMDNTHHTCCSRTDQRFAWLCGDSHGILPSCFSAKSVDNTVHVVLQHVRDLPGCVVIFTALYPLVYPPDPWTTHWIRFQHIRDLPGFVVIMVSLLACCPPTDQRVIGCMVTLTVLYCSCFSARCVWSWTTHCARCPPTDQRFAWLCGDSHGIVPSCFSPSKSVRSWTTHRARCPPTDQRFAWLCGDSHGIVPSCFSPSRSVWWWTTD